MDPTREGGEAMRTHIVNINKEKHYFAKDELYTDWYKCPSCGNTYVFFKNRFCSNCGAQFKWTEGGDK